MNKKMTLSALAIVAVSSSAAFALTAPGGGVVGSIHDMNIYTAPGLVQDTQGRVCAFCHTPHHALTVGSDYLPLWSHTLATTSYQPYLTATLDAQIDPDLMMEGPSKLCMSCHDGAVAVDTHYATTGGAYLKEADGYGGSGIAQTATLTNDHPIGFIFDADDGGVAAGPISGNPTNIDNTANNAPSEQLKDNWIRTKEATYIDNPTVRIMDRLYTGSQGQPIMTCATCHDVHNRKNPADGTNTNYLLLSPNTGSKICLTCHIK